MRKRRHLARYPAGLRALRGGRRGIEAVNIRSIARKAGIAVNRLHYFANKDEILLALTEAYWKQALVELGTPSPPIPSAASWKKYLPFEGPDRPLRQSAHGQPGEWSM